VCVCVLAVSSARSPELLLAAGGVIGQLSAALPIHT